MSQGYWVHNGKIEAENGLPCEPRWFCDNRVSFQIKHGELCDLQYFNPRTNSCRILRSQFWGGIKLYLYNKKQRIQVLPQKCCIYPFGFKSQNNINGIQFSYSIFTVNDAVFFTIHILEGSEPKFSFSLEMYEDQKACMGEAYNDLRYGGACSRKWSSWLASEKAAACSFDEEGALTGMAFCGTRPIDLQKTKAFGKNRFCMHEITQGQSVSMVLCFGDNEAAAIGNCREALQAQDIWWNTILERYDAVAQRTPKISSGNASLDQAMELIPYYFESLKIKEKSGGLRAKTTMYWMWGWDSITSVRACSYWGDSDFCMKLANCLREYASGDAIPHAFGQNMQASCTGTVTNAFYIFLIGMLDDADADVQEFYPFIKRLYFAMVADEIPGLGLCKGRSLIPDILYAVKETGHDISTFNNVLIYAASRTMERLAARHNDSDTSQWSAAYSKRCKEHMDMLFNSECGFWDSSADSDTYALRNVLSNNAFKWENPYCDELTAKHMQDCFAFYRTELCSTNGIRPYPIWSDVFDSDANQLSAWFPNITEFYARLLNRFDCCDGLTQWVSWLTRYTDRLLFPEGIPCYADTLPTHLDEWNNQSGTWQAFGMRAFYTSVIESYIGVYADYGGLQFAPNSLGECAIDNLHFGSHTAQIRFCGKGRFVSEIQINGEHVVGTNKIPYDLLREENKVHIIKTELEPALYISEAYESRIAKYGYLSGCIEFEAQTYGEHTITVHAKQAVEVCINNTLKVLLPDEQGCVTILLSENKNHVCIRLI